VDEDEDIRLRKTRDKRLKKHYSIKVGDSDIKIINYLFKRWTNKLEDIELLILKSNIPFPTVDAGELAIEIKTGDKELRILGKYHHGVIAGGIYDLAFSVKEKSESSPLAGT
jgi:hypothetical protein